METSNPIFTRQHYISLTNWLGSFKASDEVFNQTVFSLMEHFKEDNPNFNATLFLRAAVERRTKRIVFGNSGDVL